MPFRTRRLFTRGTPRGCLATSAQWQPPLVGEFIAHYSKLYAGPNRVVSKFPGGHTQYYDSRLAISVIYFSYSARESRPPSRSTRARSLAGRDAWISSTRFHGA